MFITKKYNLTDNYLQALNSFLYQFKKNFLIDVDVSEIPCTFSEKQILKNLRLEKRSVNELNISNDIVTVVIQKIKRFEQNKCYLEQNINLVSMAKELETNSTYLSKIINAEKKKNFSNYINDLRIEYTVEQLKCNKQFRKYSVLAIANEVGFNNTKSFSRAFLKKTGKQTSLFIKELV